MNKSNIQKIDIRKDGFISKTPWVADIHFINGTIWKSWVYGKTKKYIVDYVKNLGCGDFI